MASKPLAATEFKGLVAMLLGFTIEEIPPALFKETLKTIIDEPNKLRILVVDDNAINRMVMAGMLKKCQQEAIYAQNGLEAVNILMQDEAIFDVVFMDCEMPIMDGYTATRKIREWEIEHQHSHTLIIALTAHALPEQADICKKNGMDEYMVKPINLALLQNTLSLIRTHT